MKPYHILLSTLLAQGIHALEIRNAKDLEAFSKRVSQGATFAGETVFLSDDLDLQMVHSFQPIGTGDEYADVYNPFLGTFDGQGYTIKHLNISTSSHFVGLIGSLGDYGFTRGGGVVSNVVLDSTCTIESRCTDEYCYGYQGGIVGFCYGQDANCIVENSVNMATVVSHGNAQMIGGIIGHCSVDGTHICTVYNCANYGNIRFNTTDVKDTNWMFFVGGIAGFCGGTLKGKCSIQNTVNYGTISANLNMTQHVNIGGVLGFGNDNVHVQNCVAMGSIAANSALTDSFVGTIVGLYEYEETPSTITYSYWKPMGPAASKACGNCDELYTEINNVSAIGMIEYILDVGILVENDTVSSLVEALNRKTGSGHSSWGTAFFHCGDGDCTGLETVEASKTQGIDDPGNSGSSLVLFGSFPRPTKGALKFLGWHFDENLTQKVNEMEYRNPVLSENASEFYARFGSDVVKVVVRYPKDGTTPYEKVVEELESFAECPFTYLFYEAGGTDSESESLSDSFSSASVFASSSVESGSEGKQARDVMSSGSEKISGSLSKSESDGSSKSGSIAKSSSSSEFKDKKKSDDDDEEEMALFTGVMQFSAGNGEDEYGCAESFISNLEG